MVAPARRAAPAPGGGARRAAARAGRRRRAPGGRRRRRRRRRGRELALTPVAPLGGAASGTARLADDGERATLHLTGLRPSRAGDFYELWLLNGPDDLVSLGSFTVPASGAVDVSVPVPGGTRGFAALDISVEPPDGDPAHSSRSVLRAPLERS